MWFVLVCDLFSVLHLFLSILRSLCWRWLSWPRSAAPCSMASIWPLSTLLHRFVSPPHHHHQRIRIIFTHCPKNPKLSANEWRRLPFAHSDSVWLLAVKLWRSDCISLSCEVMWLCVWNLEAAVCLTMSSMLFEYYPSCARLLRCLIWRGPVTALRTD